MQTGLRVSELVGLRCQDVVLSAGAHVHCYGKGRKECSTPLRKETVAAVQVWLREHQGGPLDPAFPNNRGGSLSRDAVEYLLAKYLVRARQHCASLQQKHVTPHVLRHYLPFLTMSGNVGKRRCKRSLGAAFTRDNLGLFRKTKNRHRIEMTRSVGREPCESRIHLLSLLFGRRTDAE